jgi:23S rRNA (uracil1939-C5)-methyltransferase
MPQLEHEIDLESLAFGGSAIGHLEGKVIFVPYGVPGDRVKVRITKAHASYCQAEIRKILRQSPSRRAAQCSHFGSCGGCQWQHIDYALQTASKHEQFTWMMAKSGVSQVLPLIQSAKEFGYRRRFRMHWQVREGDVTLGYYKRNSKELLDVSQCPLLMEPLEEAARLVRQALQFIDWGKGTIVAVADGSRRTVHVSMRLLRGEGKRLPTLIQELHQPPIEGGTVQQGSTTLSFGTPSLNLRMSGESRLEGSSLAFCQANPEQDRRMRQGVVDWIDFSGKRVLELFAGVGNLTSEFAALAQEVAAVETSAAAVAHFQRNLSPLLSRVRGLTQDATQALEQFVQHKEQFDIVVLNPPREGCPTVMPLLEQLRPRQLVYISCDPMTLSRDLVALSSVGFLPIQARAHDMMPQTYHIEGMVLLGR